MKLELALAFHHAVCGNREQLTVGLGRLSELSEGGDHAYYIEITRFMAGLPSSPEASVEWVGDTDDVRHRWYRLVQQRRAGLWG